MGEGRRCRELRPRPAARTPFRAARRPDVDKESEQTLNQPFVPGVGAVFSADIAVPDHEREVRFYSRVLSTGETPLWREEDLMNNLGMPIIGLGARSPEHAHLPLQWMPHIQVADVAASVQRGLSLGGSVLMHAKDDDGSSQWAVLVDPQGAAFGIIPVVRPEAIPPIDGAGSRDGAAPVGRIRWLDLTVSDASATRDFYRQVVGWSVQSVEMEDAGERYADYNMLGGDGTPAAGVCHARGVNTSLPAVWVIYLPVGDLAESLRRVEEEGGKVVKATQQQGGEYLYAAIQDPVGAYFALVAG
jgi:predicted enzyme related to lactoylglutathione lyase